MFATVCYFGYIRLLPIISQKDQRDIDGPLGLLEFSDTFGLSAPTLYRDTVCVSSVFRKQCSGDAILCTEETVGERIVLCVTDL